jgi:uncharacterized protein (DUF302 family)
MVTGVIGSCAGTRNTREPAETCCRGRALKEQLVSDGMITVESGFPVPETIDRLAAAVAQAGLVVFARIDHGQGAREAGLELRPTELLIFGHPRGGTPLMLDCQLAGIDLPFKALSWEDEDGRVWLAWNDAGWLARRHRLSTASAAAVQAIADGMSGLARIAAGPASHNSIHQIACASNRSDIALQLPVTTSTRDRVVLAAGHARAGAGPDEARVLLTAADGKPGRVKIRRSKGLRARRAGR